MSELVREIRYVSGGYVTYMQTGERLSGYLTEGSAYGACRDALGVLGGGKIIRANGDEVEITVDDAGNVLESPERLCGHCGAPEKWLDRYKCDSSKGGQPTWACARIAELGGMRATVS